MTNTSTIHLSEEDRQRAADGTLDAGDRARVQAHLAECRACSDDVAALAPLMRQLANADRAPRTDTPGLDEMWRGIRERIDGAKVIPLDSPATPASSRRLRVDPWMIGAAAAVTAITTVTILRVVPARVGPTVVSVASADSALRLADDSVRMYQEQVDRLLDDVKLERDQLVPETRASIDEDLATVDRAIAELQAAIVRDPKNPALRTMLASSYRQKIDVLKRIANAG